MIEYNDLMNNIIFQNQGNTVSLNLFLFIVLAFLFSLAIDVIFGELPTRIHPVVMIGSVVSFFKKLFISMKNRWSGLLTTLLTCAVACLVTLLILYLLSFNIVLFFIAYSIILSSTFSVKMLLETAISVYDDLCESLDRARESVSYLVSRSTDELTESFIVSATIESMTENITDSYTAPIFYYMIFAVVLLLLNKNYLFVLLLIPLIYRISNTLDAMLGYKTDELMNIGFFPAKLDDILNYVPSRITGLVMVLSAFLLRYDWKNAYNIMMRDARVCPSPNSGYTMATAAGALDIQLIKKQTYILGDEIKPIDKDDIKKAVKLSRLTIILFTIMILIILTLVYVIL